MYSKLNQICLTCNNKWYINVSKIYLILNPILDGWRGHTTKQFFRSGAPLWFTLSVYSKCIRCVCMYLYKPLFWKLHNLQLIHFTDILIRYKPFWIKKLYFSSSKFQKSSLSFYPCIVKNGIINYRNFIFIVILFIFFPASMDGSSLFFFETHWLIFIVWDEFA